MGLYWSCLPSLCHSLCCLVQTGRAGGEVQVSGGGVQNCSEDRGWEVQGGVWLVLSWSGYRNGIVLCWPSL